MKVSTTTKRFVNLKEEYGNKKVTIEAIDTNLFVYRNGTASQSLRKTENTETTTGYSAAKYTVADASFYRKGEIVLVTSGADARKGTARVKNNTETGKIEIMEYSFTPASGDKIIVPMDEFIKSGTFIELDKGCEIVQTVIILAAEDTDGDNCSIEENETKKKN